MIDIDTRDRGEQRKFGITMAIAIAILGLIRWGIGYLLHPETVGGYPVGFLVVAAPFLVLGLAAPGILRPLFDWWLKLALVLNWIMTRVALTLAWFLLFLPTRAILVVLRKRLLQREWLPEAETYWEEPEAQPEEIEKYRHQF